MRTWGSGKAMAQVPQGTALAATSVRTTQGDYTVATALHLGRYTTTVTHHAAGSTTRYRNLGGVAVTPAAAMANHTSTVQAVTDQQ